MEKIGIPIAQNRKFMYTEYIAIEHADDTDARKRKSALAAFSAS